jgi:hypothetical protein
MKWLLAGSGSGSFSLFLRYTNIVVAIRPVNPETLWVLSTDY